MINGSWLIAQGSPAGAPGTLRGGVSSITNLSFHAFRKILITHSRLEKVRWIFTCSGTAFSIFQIPISRTQSYKMFQFHNSQVSKIQKQANTVSQIHNFKIPTFQHQNYKFSKNQFRPFKNDTRTVRHFLQHLRFPGLQMQHFLVLKNDVVFSCVFKLLLHKIRRGRGKVHQTVEIRTFLKMQLISRT